MNCALVPTIASQSIEFVSLVNCCAMVYDICTVGNPCVGAHLLARTHLWADAVFLFALARHQVGVIVCARCFALVAVGHATVLAANWVVLLQAFTAMSYEANQCIRYMTRNSFW